MLVEPGDGSWVVHAPFGLKRPWLYGLWYSLARLVLLKYYGIRDSGRLGERAYLLVASAPDSAMQADRDELANDLAKDGAAVVALAPGYKLESVKLGEDSHEIYETQVEMANQAITILIRGGNLTTNTQGGSRAAAEVQERTGDGVKLAFDAETLAETLHEQSLVWWAEFNFGDRKLAPWPSWPVEPEEDKKQRSDMIVQLGTGLEKLEQLGFEIDGDAVIEDFDLTFIKRRKSDDERAADAQKKLEQQQAMQPAGVPGKQPPEPAPGKNAKQRAGGFSARLASGASSVANSGFVAGQLYADAIVDNAVEHANESLEQTITLIGKAIDESTDYEDLRARLKALFGDVSTEELNELVYRTMLLAEMAGRKAVTQDA
jgi:phage gp29-like protein